MLPLYQCPVFTNTTLSPLDLPSFNQFSIGFNAFKETTSVSLNNIPQYSQFGTGEFTFSPNENNESFSKIDFSSSTIDDNNGFAEKIRNNCSQQ